MEHPTTPKIPQVTFDEHVNETSKSNFKTLLHVYDKILSSMYKVTKRYRQQKRFSEIKLAKGTTTGRQKIENSTKITKASARTNRKGENFITLVLNMQIKMKETK